MKELSLKQLYGYSIMNWEQYLSKLWNAENGRDCSFCVDLEKRNNGKYDLDCSEGDCKINPFICYASGNKGYFNKINKTTRRLYDEVNVLITRLRIEYDKL